MVLRDHPLFVYAKIYLREMKKYYLLLCVLLVVFFSFNFFIYTRTYNITFEKISLLKKEKPKETISVLNFGDVMFDRGVRNIMENRGRDPFEYIKKDLELIKSFDIVIANLEGPIVEMDRKLCQQKNYNFQFASTTTRILKSVGINIVNLANNHTYDCLRFGYESTKKYLTEAGIDYTGDRELEKSFVIKVIRGKRIAFVGMDETTPLIPVSDFYSLVKQLKSENDYVVVNIHWGTEYSLLETDTQRYIAHNLIDNGADVIFGHHPHVIESIEVYKGKVIFYSLGNFVFDQNFGDTTIGFGAGVKFLDDSSTSSPQRKTIFTIFPYNIKMFAPDFLKDDEKNQFCQKYLKDLAHTGCVFEI